jgi:hypothetical protein
MQQFILLKRKLYRLLSYQKKKISDLMYKNKQNLLDKTIKLICLKYGKEKRFQENVSVSF